MSNDSEGKKLSELRVVDLRSELEKRGLEKTGIKIQLLERLVKALKDEGHEPETYEFKGVSKRITPSARAESESDVSTMAEDAADKQEQDEEMTDDHNKENNDEKLKADVNGTETEDSLNLTIEDDEDTLLNESNDETLQCAEKTNGSGTAFESSIGIDLNKSQPNEDEERKDEDADLDENQKGKSTDISTEDKDATSEREDSSATVPEPTTATTGGDSSINEEPTSGEVQAETGGGEVNSTSGGTAEADSANTSTSQKTEKDANAGRSLWISRLSTLTRATDLKHLFSKYGKVVGAKVVTNARTPSARCYGYVIMATTADAENCIKRVHKTELHGRFISVEKARSDKNDTANKESRKFETDKPDEKNEKRGSVIDEKNKPKDIKEKEVNKDDLKEKEKASSDIDRSRKSRNEKNSKSRDRDREPDRRDRHRSAGSGRSGKDRNKRKDDTSNEREKEREKEKDRGERDRDRSRLRRRSSERDRTRRTDVLTFKQILEERGRQRQRERERTWREIENRKREIERIEIERRKVEQTKLLIKEQDRLRIERERLQRAKRETQQVLREVEKMKRDIERKKVERDESLKKQREHQLAKEDLLRVERERLEMERLELKRQQMHLVEQARHATKRPADDRRDVYTDDRKRVATSSSSHRFEAPPVPHYDVPSSPAPPGIISKKHDNYKSHESRNDYKMRDEFRSRDDVKTRDDYKSRDEYSKRDDYKRDRGDFAPPPPMLSGPSSHSSMPVKYSGPDSPYAGNVRAPSRDVRREVIPSNVRGSASSKDLRFSDRSGGPVDRSPPSAPSYRESDHRSSKSDIRSSRDHRYSESSMKDSSHYSDRESGGWHSGPSPIKPYGAQSSGGSGRDNWLKNENESMGGGGWSNASSGHPQNSARWVNSPSSRLMSGGGGAYGGNSAGSSGGLAPPGVSGSSYAADQRYESYKSSMGSSLRKY